MKKVLLSIVGTCLLGFLLAHPAFPTVSLQFDFNGNPSNWESQCNLNLNDTVQLDVYLVKDAPGDPSEYSEVFYQFHWDQERIKVIDVWANDVSMGGPWDYSYKQFMDPCCDLGVSASWPSCVTLVDNKMLLHSIVLECSGAGDGWIEVRNGDIYDCDFDDHVVGILRATIHGPCAIIIAPESADEVRPNETILFSAIEEGTCNVPSYGWQVTPDCGSKIDSNGLYCAGNVIDDCTDTITLTDEANNIKNTATVHIDAECIVVITNPPSKPVKVGETYDFDSDESGCENEPCYTWSVSAIGTTGNTGNTGGGNTIEASPMYYTWSVSAAGTTGNTGNTIDANGLYVCRVAETDLVKVTDACNNNISDTAVVICGSTTTTTIPAKLCTSSKECNDGLFCNGLERCAGGRCKPGSYPCPEDDGLFCNGVESCDEENDVCIQSNAPCAPGLICDEERNLCIECLDDAKCKDELFCNGVEKCVEGVCQLGTNPCKEGEECDEVNGCLPKILACAISIEPEAADVVSGQTLSFTVTTEGDCGIPDYEWSIESTIGSKIDQNGNYTAGLNLNISTPASDVVKVVDRGNGDAQAEATITVSLCPSVQLYGEHSKEVEALRSFRDNVLSTTPEGQELIRLYYEWGPAVAKAMRENQEFKEEVKGIMDAMIPLLIIK